MEIHKRIALLVSMLFLVFGNQLSKDSGERQQQSNSACDNTVCY